MRETTLISLQFLTFPVFLSRVPHNVNKFFVENVSNRDGTIILKKENNAQKVFYLFFCNVKLFLYRIILDESLDGRILRNHSLWEFLYFGEGNFR